MPKLAPEDPRSLEALLVTFGTLDLGIEPDEITELGAGQCQQSVSGAELTNRTSRRRRIRSCASQPVRQSTGGTSVI